jgi:hypothetical protein
MSITEEMFQESLDYWKNSKGNSSTSFWPMLADKYGMTSDALRSMFKRERAKRGIKKTEQRTVQQQPRVGVMDIETLPIEIRGLLWGVRDQWISPDMVANDSSLLSWAGKRLGSTEISSDIMTPKEAKAYNSKRVVKSAMDFINTLDIVIGFNWKNFDGKVLNTELAQHRLPPVKYRDLDLYNVLRTNFRMTSNKLSFVNQKFGIREKQPNEGMGLWEKCAQGNKEALAEMLHYNEVDVFATEELFYYIAPYANNSIPNFGTYQEDTNVQMCHCGSYDFKNDGVWFTNHAKFDRYRCVNCGAVHRGKKNLLKKDKTAGLMIRL